MDHQVIEAKLTGWSIFWALFAIGFIGNMFGRGGGKPLGGGWKGGGGNMA